MKEVRDLLGHTELLNDLKNHAKELGKPHACQDIYQEMLKTLERK